MEHGVAEDRLAAPARQQVAARQRECEAALRERVARAQVGLEVVGDPLVVHDPRRGIVGVQVDAHRAGDGPRVAHGDEGLRDALLVLALGQVHVLQLHLGR